MITTTLRQIRQHDPCREGWRTLLSALGKTKVDDEPLPLTTILQSNGLDDALWCLRTITGYDREITRFALACAHEVSHLMTDQRSLNVLYAIERHFESPLSKQEIDRILAEARAAEAAARAAEAAEAVWAAEAAAEVVWAARAAAWAARAAVWAARAAEAAEAAAEAAEEGAARGAARAEARARQAQIFERIFG